MKLIAPLDNKKHAHLAALFWCAQFTDPKPVHFVVDTGCSTTTILSDDATRLGLDCSNLNAACSVQTANGAVTPYAISEAIIIFDAHFGLFNLKQGFKGTRLHPVHCHQPTNPAMMTQHRIAAACSLLGMDFLQKYRKWQFTDKELHLMT